MAAEVSKLPTTMLHVHFLIPWLLGPAFLLHAMDINVAHYEDPIVWPIRDLMEGLEIFVSGQADAVIFQDFPVDFFALYEEHEHKMLENIRNAYDLGQSIIKHDNPNAIPLKRILEKGLEKPTTMTSYRIEHEHHELFIHCEDFLPLEPFMLKGEPLLERMGQIYGKAEGIYMEAKKILEAAQTSDWPVFDVSISGHMSGTAVAQLVGLALITDEDLKLLRLGTNVYTIGFGEFRIFSPQMIKNLKEIPGFNMRNHIVFSSVEHYFSPNIGAFDRFGTVIDLDLTRIFHSENRVVDVLKLARSLNLSEDLYLIRSLISSLIIDGTISEVFIKHAPQFFANFSYRINMLSQPRVLGTESTSLPFVPDTTHRQKVFSACVAHLQNMFRKYYNCLRKPDYYLTLAYDGSHEDPLVVYESYHDIILAINSRSLGRRIDFNFRIFPWHRADDYWTTFGLFKSRRSASEMFYVEPYVKDRNHYLNWANFFRKQWARISGQGSTMIKQISPFFDESVLFKIGIPECFIALMTDSATLLSIFRDESIEVKRFVRDVFGPLKASNYRSFPDGQKLFRSPRSDVIGSGIHQYILPQGNLLEVFKKFFQESQFKIQDLASFVNVKVLGSFSMEIMTSYHPELLSTEVTSNEVSTLINSGNQFLHRCDEGFVGKHSPLLSLETPSNPFWRRIFMIKDIYISFTGSSAVSMGLYTATKQDMIMGHLGPTAQAHFKQSKTGSYVVLQVYSSSWGFGPCSRQGCFYMLIIQDPQIIE